MQHTSQNADSVYPFCIAHDGKKGMLSQHFVTHAVPPLGFHKLLDILDNTGPPNMTSVRVSFSEYQDDSNEVLAGLPGEVLVVPLPEFLAKCSHLQELVHF